MVRVGLTQKQLNLYKFIKSEIETKGIAPSFDEMKVSQGLKSKSGIHRLINALVSRGYLVRHKYRARAIGLPCEANGPSKNSDVFAGDIMRLAEMATLGSISKSEALRRIYAEARSYRIDADDG